MYIYTSVATTLTFGDCECRFIHKLSLFVQVILCKKVQKYIATHVYNIILLRDVKFILYAQSDLECMRGVEVEKKIRKRIFQYRIKVLFLFVISILLDLIHFSYDVVVIVLYNQINQTRAHKTLAHALR